MMRKQSEAYGKAGNIATEILSEIKTVKAFGGESKGATRLLLLRNDSILSLIY